MTQILLTEPTINFVATEPQPQATQNSTPLADHLSALAYLADKATWAPAELDALHRLVAALVATANEATGVGVPCPSSDDGLALHLRTLGCLASRTSGRSVWISPSETIRLDLLSSELDRRIDGQGATGVSSGPRRGVEQFGSSSGS